MITFDKVLKLSQDESDQMRRFVALKGLPPQHMLASSKKTEKFFEVGG